jgi:hypothetical protein
MLGEEAFHEPNDIHATSGEMSGDEAKKFRVREPFLLRECPSE